MVGVVYCLAAAALLFSPVAGGQPEELQCVSADYQQPRRASSTLRCPAGARCYGLWEQRGGGVRLVSQGCWPHMADQQACHSDRCLVTVTPSQIQNGNLRFCCCNTHLCNVNYTQEDTLTHTPVVAEAVQSEERLCAFADHKQEGAEPEDERANKLRGVVQQNGMVRCPRGSRCYGLWEKRRDSEMRLISQGCWADQACHGDRCLVTVTPSQIQNGSLRFCCCNTHLCNVNYTQEDTLTHTPVVAEDPRTPVETLVIALVSVAMAAVLITVLYFGFRKLRGKQKHADHNPAVLEAPEPVDLDNLKLLELIGRGRYGSVYRARLSERPVAVKLFGCSGRHNYANERAIYGLPLLREHTNIARFLAAHERASADGRPEYLIVMELYHHGSLASFLSVHTADWTTCCRMTHSATKGLAYLHSEVCRGELYKPAVAHRDVNSRNILVRSDLSCVLGDLGLAMTLTGSHLHRNGDDDSAAISEVGTVRYMAPEVLEGAVNLRDCESALKQVDMYSMGLVYWETFRRCNNLFPGECAPEYQLAYQEELGNQPSLEQMQLLVSREKIRPRFPDTWKNNSLAVRSLKETMEDCWDQDAEARLTAQCAQERLSDLLLVWSQPTGTAIHNHRNLSSSHHVPNIGPSPSSYIEDNQVGMVKNLHGVGHPATSIIAASGVGGASAATERNRNSINYERQQAQCPEISVSTGTVLSTLSEHSGAAVEGVPGCLQLTEDDLKTKKLDPKEVDRNLKESSDENLMQHSEKQFTCDPLVSTTTNLLYPLRGPGPAGTEPRPLPLQLPKQQNLPRRPSSLPLGRPGRAEAHRANTRQVETGVAKMNTVMVAVAVEPHVVTMVSNNPPGGGLALGRVSCAAVGLVTGGGRTNPAGPQVGEGEAETEVEGGRGLLNASPDEHQPLLASDQLAAGTNSNNNNNNRPPPGLEVAYRGQHTPAALEERIPSPGAPPDTPLSPQQGAGWGAGRPREPRVRRPKRPSSLDLSSTSCTSCTSSAGEDSSTRVSGEKIKRRIKTPYTLKKWRPASWVVSMDTSLDMEFEFNTDHRGAGINQSKSSMAVFLIGRGATATSDPSSLTCL